MKVKYGCDVHTPKKLIQPKLNGLCYARVFVIGIILSCYIMIFYSLKIRSNSTSSINKAIYFLFFFEQINKAICIL
jgi:hypothetical protein